MKSLRAVVAALAVVASMTVVTPAAQASPDPNLTITNVALGRTSVAVSSLNLVAVPVTVEAKHSNPSDYDPFWLNVFLERTGGTGPAAGMVAASLKLASGNPLTGGVWKGTLYVPSTANGTFQVTSVKAGATIDGSDGGGLDPTPYPNGPSIAVTGLNLPKISVSVIPKIVPFGVPYKVRVTVYNSATGKPYGTRIKNVQVTGDNLCVEYHGPSYTTNTAGVVEVTLPASLAQYLNCVRLSGPAFDIIGVGWHNLRPGIVGAVPSKTSVKVGTIVPVNGTVAGAPQSCPVELQRLMGATQWRGVSKDVVRASGRFTVLAQPPYVGNVVYRVSLPTCHEFQAGVSKTFVIRGT